MDAREWQERNTRRRLDGKPEYPYAGQDAEFPAGEPADPGVDAGEPAPKPRHRRPAKADA
jgi:hypothetical protein